MVQAAATALLGAFSNQSKREPKERPMVQSALPSLSAAPNTRVANKIAKEAREERLYNLLAQPEVLGMVMALGGLILANNVPFSADDEKNALLQSVASTMSVAMGMGYAGVGDLTSLAVAVAAGASSLMGGFIGVDGLPVNHSSDQFNEWAKLLNPIYMFQSLFS